MAETPTIAQSTEIKRFNLLDSVKNAVAAQTKNNVANNGVRYSVVPAMQVHIVNKPEDIKVPSTAPADVTKLVDQFKAQHPNGNMAMPGSPQGIVVLPDGTAKYAAGGVNSIPGATYYNFDGRTYTAPVATNTASTTPNKIREPVPTKIATPATKYEKTNKVIINNKVIPTKTPVVGDKKISIITPVNKAPVVGDKIIKLDPREANGTLVTKIPFGISEEEWAKAQNTKVSIPKNEKITPVDKSMKITPIGKPVPADKIIKLDPREANGTLVTKIPFGLSEAEWTKAQNTKVSIDPREKAGTLVTADKATVTGHSKAPMAPWVKDRYIKEGKPLVDGSIHTPIVPIADPTGRTGPTEYMNKPPVANKPTEMMNKPAIAIPTGNTSNTVTRNVSSILQGTNKISSMIGSNSNILANTKPSQPALNIQTTRSYNTALLANTKPVEGETRRRNVMISTSSSGKKITL